MISKRLTRIIFLSLILLIGCEKEELPNELNGTKWKRVESYSSKGWHIEYDDKGNWYTIPYTETDITTTELIFTDNHSGVIKIKHTIRERQQDETKEYVLYDVTSDFQYSYDSQSRRGKISYVLDFKGTSVEGLYSNINANYDFGLFFDSDDLWLKDRNKVFTKLE